MWLSVKGQDENSWSLSLYFNYILKSTTRLANPWDSVRIQTWKFNSAIVVGGLFSVSSIFHAVSTNYLKNSKIDDKVIFYCSTFPIYTFPSIFCLCVLQKKIFIFVPYLFFMRTASSLVLHSYWTPVVADTH